MKRRYSRGPGPNKPPELIEELFSPFVKGRIDDPDGIEESYERIRKRVNYETGA